MLRPLKVTVRLQEGVEAYTVNDLRAMARAAGLAGFSRMNKTELVDANRRAAFAV